MSPRLIAVLPSPVPDPTSGILAHRAGVRPGRRPGRRSCQDRPVQPGNAEADGSAPSPDRRPTHRWPTDDTAPGAAGLPLAGVRVLDLSRIVAGPLAAMILGDLGADVIKVERAGAGDEPRRWGPPFHGEVAAYFLAVNRNRRSIAIDLTKPQGQQVVAALASAADIVIENYLPSQTAKLGLDGIRAGSDAVWVSLRAATARAGPREASTPRSRPVPG